MTDSIERSLGRLEGKVDGIINTQQEAKESLDRLENRTSTLERWRSQMLGGAAVAGFVASLIARAIFG
jgi:archaellum component FlaC